MSRPKKKLSCAFPNYEDISNWNVHRLLQWLRQVNFPLLVATGEEEREFVVATDCIGARWYGMTALLTNYVHV